MRQSGGSKGLTSVSFDSRLQMSTLARLLTTVALDVGSARLAHRAAVGALRDGSALFVDVLKRAICEIEKAVRDKLQSKRREANVVEALPRGRAHRGARHGRLAGQVAGVRWAAVGVGVGMAAIGEPGTA